jgi:hypothetical protein
VDRVSRDTGVAQIPLLAEEWELGYQRSGLQLIVHIILKRQQKLSPKLRSDTRLKEDATLNNYTYDSAGFKQILDVA